jgi:hypothetical protein
LTFGSEIKKPVTVDDMAKLWYCAPYAQLGADADLARQRSLYATWCHNNPKACRKLSDQGIKAQNDMVGGVLLDLVGVTDATECAGGSVSGCVWTAIGLVPIGKVAKAARLLKYADDMGDAGRLLGACIHSFDPDTPVLMTDGTHRRIKHVKIGDRVVATDPKTGETGSHKVTQLHTNQDTDLVDLTIRTSDGTTATIHTTSRHPFWSDNQRDWIDAADLTVGDQLRALSGDDTVTVDAVRPYTGHRLMNDLTIDHAHAYYVIAGTTHVLVHNCGDVDSISRKIADYANGEALRPDGDGAHFGRGGQ